MHKSLIKLTKVQYLPITELQETLLVHVLTIFLIEVFFVGEGMGGSYNVSLKKRNVYWKLAIIDSTPSFSLFHCDKS